MEKDIRQGLLDHPQDSGYLYLQRKPNRNRTRLILSCFFITLSIFTITGYVFLPRLTTKELGDCGNSIEEARAKGCQFDWLAYTWVRPECFYPEVLEEFENMTDVRYYTDHSLEEQYRIPLDVVKSGEVEATWCPLSFHAIHCSEAMMKIHWALMNHRPIDDKAISYEHSAHCRMVMLDDMPQCQKPGGCVGSKTSARFSSCLYI